MHPLRQSLPLTHRALQPQQALQELIPWACLSLSVKTEDADDDSPFPLLYAHDLKGQHIVNLTTRLKQITRMRHWAVPLYCLAGFGAVRKLWVYCFAIGFLSIGKE